MELWLDTADTQFISKMLPLGIFTGITTNPTILANTGVWHEELIRQLLHIQAGPLCVQLNATDAAEMVEEARSLSRLSPRLIVKVPVTQEGLQALQQISREGIPTLATAIYSARQYFLALLSGATYAAPYFGRMMMTDLDAEEEVKSMQRIQRESLKAPKIMLAAIRSVDQVLHFAQEGIDAVTIPQSVAEDLIEEEEHTLDACAQFARDWKKSQGLTLQRG